MSTIELGHLDGTHSNLGFVSDTDPSAYYHFSLSTPASFSASLNNLSAGAGVQLINSNGAILQSSIFADTAAEAFEVTHLAPGDYALQITSAGVDTAYNLSLTIDPLTSLPIESGYFQVGKTGIVGFDFLLDGGKYEGEVAIFSLKGMEAFEPGSKGFIKEAARRALSSSEKGHIVIQDITEGAKFEAAFSWEGNFNSGDYQKVKTFTMTPGELFGVMLVPNGTVQEVFKNPLIDRDKAPLFSLSTANPNDAFQFAQMADVFGNGTTFVMEDLRADNNPDKDYNDVVFNITGATGNAINLDEVINPEKDWRTIEIGKEISQYVNKSPEFLQFNVQPIYSAGESIRLTDTKVFDENHDLTQIKFWLKEENGEWVEIESATRLNLDREGWASFDYSLSSLEHGNYQIKAVAIDEIGQTSEEVIKDFRVNAIPSQLQFELLKNSYQTGESIGITKGKIYDADGVADLAKVDFWVQETNGNWVNVGTVTQFIENQDGWASFNFEFPQELTTGTYKIKAIAADKTGKTCEEVIHDFVVNPVNEVPTNLQFFTNKPIYTTGETISLDGGKVYDSNGGNDLKNIAFWLQKEGDEWVPIRNVTQFDLGTKDWAKFDYELKNLKAGNYQIKAVAYDQAGAASDPLIRSFIVAEEIQQPTTNIPPQYLQFALQPAYSVGKAVSLLDGKVYDENGAWNLNKVEFWLKKERGEWEKLTETPQFTSESEGWANFNYTLADLAVGDYQLKAIAYDKANAASNQVIQNFSILEESAPLPTNTPPQFLQFGLESFYQVGESVELTSGKVYDANGASNLVKIEFRLKKNEGKWKELETLTDFNSETGNWESFSYAINNLTAGNYRLEAIAYDQAGAKSNIILQTFTVGYRSIETPNPRLYNRPPQDLVFSTFPLYTNAETLSFSGAKVYDRDGTGDIERIDFWLQKPTGEWVDIQDATQFTVDNKDWNRFDFSYDLKGSTPGDYQLWAVAYDKAGNQSNIARENFTVITDAGEGGLSDTVRLAIADAANLRSYDPEILEQTREWVVWVTPGQSSEQLATQIGAEDLGETGHIDNTYIWQFPNNATPALARNRLINLPSVEFAFPLVPVQLIPQFIPNDPLFANQWHLSNTGQTGGTIGADANVTTAWDSVQGRGVVIGIVDDGLQYNHPDLQANYRPLLSQDFNQAVDPQGNVFPYYLQVTLPNGTGVIRAYSKYPYDNDPAPEYKTTFTQIEQKTIRDNNFTNAWLDVPLTGVLTDMNVGVDITHSRVSDLDVSLAIPDDAIFNPLIGKYSLRSRRIGVGTDQDEEPVNLFRNIGGNGENFTNTVLDDQATNPITSGTAPFTGSFRPESALSRLNGVYASGNWNLGIRDDRFGIPPGQLNWWQLQLSTYNPHGTPVAGIAAGVGNNNLGISGVAPAAGLAGLRLIADQVTDQQIADALSHQKQEIDIYNNSWKAEDPLTHLPLDLAALAKGVKEGRGGLGSIFVFAGGNDGWLGGNVNYNGFANSRYVIPVAALDHNGEKTWYSEPGASLLISAPSSAVNADGNLVGISSTDLAGDQGYDASDYTSRASGTSSAAPVVSGTIALMLEANPNLTWRDVQHILVNTARKNDFGEIDADGRWTDTGWQKNGAGLWVNHRYGFGAVDATAAVNAARTWVPVRVEVPVSSDWQNVGDAITDGDWTGVSSTVTIDDDIAVEKVEVVFKAEHPDWRDLTLRLISPDGTQSVLAQAIPTENRDVAKPYELDNDSEYWTFTSVHHWGESSQGEWTLQVLDEEGNQVQGEWESWKLNLYGTAPEPTVTLRTTDASGNEEGNAAQFVVTRDGYLNAPLTVNYTVAGTAINGTDYKQLTGTVTIEAGKASATIGAVPILDYLAEGDETVTLSLTDTNTYNLGAANSATATITNSTPTDWYGPFVYVNPDNGHLYLLSEADTWFGAQEQAEALGGNLVAINDAAEQSWLLNTFGSTQRFAIGLTDSPIYGAIEGNFKWLNGEPVTYTNWHPSQPDNFDQVEHYGNMNFDPSTYPGQGKWNDFGFLQPVTGIIEIDPATLTQSIVNIHATDSQAGEDGNAGQIVITRVGNLDEDLTVNYTVAGTATNGVDYQELSGTATIAAGASLITIPILGLEDDFIEDINETIIINLAEGAYEIGTESLTQINLADEHPIQRLYRQIFGREIDPASFNLLLERNQNGEPLSEILTLLVFDETLGGTTTPINEIYQELRGRTATDQEISYWQNRLVAGTSLSQIRQELSGQELITTANSIYTNPTNGHRYFLTTADTWLGAQEQAKALGGNLVTINDADEQAWLVNTFGNESFWIGLTDSNLYNREEGNFQWINGEPLTYTNWYLGEPSDQASAGFEGEDFAHIYPYPDEFAGRWNDAIVSFIPEFGIVEIEPTVTLDKNLIGDWGFENIDVTGGFRSYPPLPIPEGFEWTVSHPNDAPIFDIINSFWEGVSGTTNSDGFDQSLDIDLDTTLSQSFATVPGQTYQVSLWYAHNPGMENPSSTGYVRVTGNTTLVDVTLVHDIPSTRDNINFLHYAAVFTADSETTTLSIQGDVDNWQNGFVIDDVRVTPL